MLGPRFLKCPNCVMLFIPFAILAIVTNGGRADIQTRHSAYRPSMWGRGVVDEEFGLRVDARFEVGDSPRKPKISLSKVLSALRGGQAVSWEEDKENSKDEDEDGDKEEEDNGEEVSSVVFDERSAEWILEQLCIYQTRTALISKHLSTKGYKVREIVPSPRGLVCAMSTEERRMDCRMYVEAEVGKKVVAPCKCKGTQKWISLAALNSERRKEPRKWKNCPTCQGPIDYKLYEQHGGSLGKAISGVLNNARATSVALGILVGIVVLISSPLIHYVVARVLTSGILWQNYHRLTFFFYMPLPLKIMAVRFLTQQCNMQFLELERSLRRVLTDIESEILEQRVPVTVEETENGELVTVGQATTSH